MKKISFMKIPLKLSSARFRPFLSGGGGGGGGGDELSRHPTARSSYFHPFVEPPEVAKFRAELQWLHKNEKTLLNTLRPRQNGRHFADDTFNRIFVNENARISIEFSLKFVPKGPINNIPALVPIMALRRLGDKPLSEPMLVGSLTYICVTRPQWVNSHQTTCPI